MNMQVFTFQLLLMLLISCHHATGMCTYLCTLYIAHPQKEKETSDSYTTAMHTRICVDHTEKEKGVLQN